jgi:hypothetical protein
MLTATGTSPCRSPLSESAPGMRLELDAALVVRSLGVPRQRHSSIDDEAAVAFAALCDLQLQRWTYARRGHVGFRRNRNLLERHVY